MNAVLVCVLSDSFVVCASEDELQKPSLASKLTQVSMQQLASESAGFGDIEREKAIFRPEKLGCEVPCDIACCG